MESKPSASSKQSEAERMEAIPSEALRSPATVDANSQKAKLEEEIDRLATRMLKAKAANNDGRYALLRGRLAAKCILLYRLDNNKAAYSCIDGSALQPSYEIEDETFSIALERALDTHHRAEASFVHYLRYMHKRRREELGRQIGLEAKRFGGGVLSLDKEIEDDDGSSKAFGSFIGQSDAVLDTPDEDAESAILVRTIALITGFLGKTGREANKARKLYTKLFFSETLTRSVKCRGEGELVAFERHEKDLFAAVELPFQDSYTLEQCRTIPMLWGVAFIEGIREVRRPVDESSGKNGRAPAYAWTLPATVYMSYLQSLGMSVSNSNISQQRGKYKELLKALEPNRE